jgi:hypothetical protein
MNYDLEMYNLLNPDLNKAGLLTNNQLLQHLINHKKKENRKTNIYEAYPDFNPEKYKSLYVDLKNMNKRELELHWLKYGRNENRNYKVYKPVKLLNNNNKNINNKYNIGIAITVYSSDQTPNERIQWSISCIESIVNNINNVLIIILIDKYILDNHLQSIKKLISNNKYIKLYRNTENYGIAKSKNICIKLLEKKNINLFCLFDDDIFINKSPVNYILEVFKKLDIPLLSNYNIDTHYTEISINNVSLIKCNDLFGNIIVISKKYLNIYGYFNVYPYKWGYEHIELTKRYLCKSIYNNICGNFKEYINNNTIINGINTLHLHTIDVDFSKASENLKLMDEYLKDIKYISFKNDFSADILV